ncbi:hypothetical protein ACOME3_002986 [Neoechinorhynchus agilis]
MCTTGIALKYVEADNLLRDFSHIIVDEVHERALETELLLIYLKKLLALRPDLKLILMSASVQASKFSEWIGNTNMHVPIVHVPARNYRVKSIFIEDWAEELAQMYLPMAPQWKSSKNDDNKSRFEAYIQSMGDLSPKARRVLQSIRFDKVDPMLVVAAVKKICALSYDNSNAPNRSILIFVPGMQEIKQVTHELKKYPNLHLLPLHSMLPNDLQSEVFCPAPEGKRKVIVATNIAESSITIDDVGFVIDTGFSKQEGYDTSIGTRLLQQQWITRSNVIQRLGRAGRCADGLCLHLYSRFHHDCQMADYPKSELLTNRLDGVILSVKNSGVDDVRGFLSEAVDPPTDDLLRSSIEFLASIDALQRSDHDLTPLGGHLARLPCEAQIGKLVLLGVLFDCIEPILTIAAFLGSSDPFHVIPGNESDVDKIRSKFRFCDRGPLSFSDHFMLLRVYNEWINHNQSRQFCDENLLSEYKLRNIKNVRRQLWDVVMCLNFMKRGRGYGRDYNLNGNNMDLLAFILCLAFYPNIAKAKPLVSAQRNLVLTTPSNNTLMVSQRSLCYNLTMLDLPSHYFAYFDKVKSSNTVVYDLCPVNPLSLLFCAQKLVPTNSRHTIMNNQPEVFVLDDWISVNVRRGDLDMAGALRKALDKLIADLLVNPRTIEPDSKEWFIVESIVKAVTSLSPRCRRLVIN